MASSRTAKETALVIVGMPGSGKSTLAAFLKEHRWPVVRFGDVTMEELKRRGLPVQESNEREVREGLRREHGMAAFAKLSQPAIERALREHGRVALDGLYSWSEHRYLRDHLPARLLVVAVFTPRRERYLRLAQRTVRPLTAAEAESRDCAEVDHLEKGGPIAMADQTIINSGSIEDMERALEEIIRSEGLWE